MPEIENLPAFAESLALGQADPEETKCLLIRMADRGETADEILSFVRAFEKMSVKVRTSHPAVLDMCGTGGASFRTFNVSTLASLVIASLDVPVAKHGNRSANGLCGSADFLQALGVRIELGPEEASRMLDEIGITFLFAPRYHPAMRYVAPIRKQIARKTLFNVLGPLMNPVQAEKRQLMGVYEPRLLEVVPQVMLELGFERSMVVHGTPGMDEVSTLGPTSVAEVRGGRILKYQIEPKELGLRPSSPADVAELPPQEAANAGICILQGERSPRSDMIALNAACGLFVFGKVDSIEKGLDLAYGSLDNGTALRKLEQMIAMSQAEGVQ